MISNPIDQAMRITRHMEIVQNFLGMKGRFVGDMVHIGIADLAAVIRTLKDTHVIIPKKDLPSGLREAVSRLQNLHSLPSEGLLLSLNDAVILIETATLVAEQLEG